MLGLQNVSRSKEPIRQKENEEPFTRRAGETSWRLAENRQTGPSEKIQGQWGESPNGEENEFKFERSFVILAETKRGITSGE